jgi:hypothetical protein
VLADKLMGLAADSPDMPASRYAMMH